MKNEDFGEPIVAFTQFVPGRIHLKDHLRQRSLLWGEPSDSATNAANVAIGTNRTNRTGLTMSVDRGRAEVVFRGRQDRF
jgi:hypothetical protein